MYHPNLVFVEERPDFHTPLQQTNEQTLTTSKQKIGIYLQLLSSPIAQCTEVNFRTWINRRWEWITLSVRSLTVFEENIVVTVLAKLVSLFFKNVHALFSFLTRPLIDRCQIVTDTCIIMFQSLFGSLLNHFYHYANENVLFNLRHLYFNYHLLAQKLLSLWKILPYLQP